MNTALRHVKLSWLATLGIIILLAGCSALGAKDGVTKFTLAGAAEVPPVTTTAYGQGAITVAPDKSVSGMATTYGLSGTAAHIHEGAPGQNGPVIVPLIKTADSSWSVPAGVTFTAAQHASYMTGNLYVNVHSAAYPAGELRGQLIPKK